MNCMKLLSTGRIKEIINNPELVSGLSIEEIKELIFNAKLILKNKPNLIQFNHKDKILLIGDIHGKFDSLISIQKLINRNNYQYYQKIIFLGDYVDRGPKQIQSINYVLLLKLLFPNKIILLRGNHETTSMNRYYGYYNVVCKELGKEIFDIYTDLYGNFPLASFSDTGIFCVHGGIPETLENIKQINEINRFYSDVDFNDNILMQLLWNDPTAADTDYFISSLRGPTIKRFGLKAFQDFILNNNIKLFIRAHEAFLEGYKYFFNKKLLSIFSASKYRANNQAIVAEIDLKLNIKLISID